MAKKSLREREIRLLAHVLVNFRYKFDERDLAVSLQWPLEQVRQTLKTCAALGLLNRSAEDRMFVEEDLESTPLDPEDLWQEILAANSPWPWEPVEDPLAPLGAKGSHEIWIPGPGLDDLVRSAVVECRRKPDGSLEVRLTRPLGSILHHQMIDPAEGC